MIFSLNKKGKAQTKTAVIATTTLVENENGVRAKLNLKTAEEIQRRGFRFVVIDGGSPNDFCEALKERGAEILSQKEAGMGPGRRQALFEASVRAGQNGAVIWMEPEKYPLVVKIPKFVSLVMKEDIDLLVPARKNLNSYPPEQKHEETFFNLAVQSLTGLKWDFSFGPFVARQNALRYFLEYSGEYGDLWDSTLIPRFQIAAAGLKIKCLEMSYVHPAEQTLEETGNPDFVMKRFKQLDNLIPACAKEAQKLGLRKAIRQ